MYDIVNLKITKIIPIGTMNLRIETIPKPSEDFKLPTNKSNTFIV